MFHIWLEFESWRTWDTLQNRFKLQLYKDRQIQKSLSLSLAVVRFETLTSFT